MLFQHQGYLPLPFRIDFWFWGGGEGGVNQWLGQGFWPVAQVISGGEGEAVICHWGKGQGT